MAKTIIKGIFDDPSIPIVNGPASAPNPVAALARFMRTCEALLLLVNSCYSASPVAPYPTPAKQPASVNRTALSKVTTPINPIKAIIIPRRMNQIKSIFGPNT